MSPSEVPGAKTLLSFFSALEDPRIARTQKHPLLTVVVIATLGVICGAEGWDELHVFGTKKQALLATFLDMQSGVPCADTFRRVFEALRPRAFATCFERFVQALATSADAPQGNRQVAIDGKTLRHSFDTATGHPALHLVHAWCVDHHLLLGQVATSEKSNEITAIPALLALLDLRATTVTTDAMGCQKAIAEEIRKGGGEYLLALKDNHPTLCPEVETLFEQDATRKQRVADSTSERSKGHGRVETRYVRALCAPTTLPGYKEWKDLKSLVCVSSVRCIGEHRSEERRFYLTSLDADAKELAQKIRRHWDVENALHWTLDVAMAEDASRIRSTNGTENFAMLRRVALMLLKREKSVKMGIRAKQKAAGWSNDNLVRILFAGLADVDAVPNA